MLQKIKELYAVHGPLLVVGWLAMCLTPGEFTSPDDRVEPPLHPMDRNAFGTGVRQRDTDRRSESRPGAPVVTPALQPRPALYSETLINTEFNPSVIRCRAS